MGDERIGPWLAALQTRHQAALTSHEFLKAVRALSARYVERRSELAGRSALDSAGKRAAFAAFYAPLHFFTAREVIRSLGAGSACAETIVDLGCGTGVASAAWALALQTAELRGVDRHAWAVQETQWTWRELGLVGRGRQADLTEAAERLARTRDRLDRTAIIAGWSVNELRSAERTRLLQTLLAMGSRKAAILVIEPLARAATPWWDEWTSAFTIAGGRADQWKFDVALPEPLARIDEAAGFRREGLGAKSLWLAA